MSAGTSNLHRPILQGQATPVDQRSLANHPAKVHDGYMGEKPLGIDEGTLQPTALAGSGALRGAVDTAPPAAAAGGIDTTPDNVRHGVAAAARRDPGPEFPWDRFGHRQEADEVSAAIPGREDAEVDAAVLGEAGGVGDGVSAGAAAAAGRGAGGDDPQPASSGTDDAGTVADEHSTN